MVLRRGVRARVPRDEVVEGRSLMAESYDPGHPGRAALGHAPHGRPAPHHVHTRAVREPGVPPALLDLRRGDTLAGRLWDNVFFMLSLATMLAGILAEGAADNALARSIPGHLQTYGRDRSRTGCLTCAAPETCRVAVRL